MSEILENEKDYLMMAFANPKSLKYIVLIFAFILLGTVHSYYEKQGIVLEEDLKTIAVFNPHAPKARGINWIEFQNMLHKGTRFRVNPYYITHDERWWLFANDTIGKRYQIQVRKQDLLHVGDGDKIEAFSLKDADRVYMTVKQYNQRNRSRFSDFFALFAGLSLLFLFWILILLVIRRRQMKST